MAFQYTASMFPVPPLQDPNDPRSKPVRNLRLTNTAPKYMIYVRVQVPGSSAGNCPKGEFVGRLIGRTDDGLVKFRVLACTTNFKVRKPVNANGTPYVCAHSGKEYTVSRSQVAVANPYYANPEVKRVAEPSYDYYAANHHNLCRAAWALQVATASIKHNAKNALISRIATWTADAKVPRLTTNLGLSFDAIGNRSGDFVRLVKGSKYFSANYRANAERRVADFRKQNKTTGELVAYAANRFRNTPTVAKANKIRDKLRRDSCKYTYRGKARFAESFNQSLAVGCFGKLVKTINPLVTMLSCGHYSDAKTKAQLVYEHLGVPLEDSVTRQMCPVCFEKLRSAGHYVMAVLDVLGAQGWVNRNNMRIYNLPEAVPGQIQGQGAVIYTCVRPETAIGSYHSSRNYFVKPLPHISGHNVSESEVKVGFELEFVRSQNCSRSLEALALDMKKRLTPISDVVIKAKAGDRYAGFEYDGSVDYEMVTGYGPLDIHRAAVIELLGGAPYAGELTSHDGGRCGLHVHIDKPTSLLHAARMTAFYHAQANKSLIKAISRRYENSRYALPVPDKMSDKYQIKNLWANAKYGMSNNRVKAERGRLLAHAIGSINGGNRYELLNFQPNRTVEVRAFRGSMLPNSVIACLEFAYMSYIFTRDSTDTSTGAFLQFISTARHRHDTTYLRRYLKNKGFDVWVPSNPKVAVANTTDETEAVT